MKQEIKNLKTSEVSKNLQFNYKTMLSYCLKYGRKTGSKNPKVIKTKNERIIVVSKCLVC